MNNPHLNPTKLDPAAVSTASPRHIQSVIEDLVELLGVRTEVIERAAALLETAAQVGITPFYEDRTDTPNRTYCLKVVKDLRNLLTNPSSVA